MSGSETLMEGDSEASACNKVGSAAEAAISDLLEVVGVTGMELDPKAVDGRRKSWARAVEGWEGEGGGGGGGFNSYQVSVFYISRGPLPGSGPRAARSQNHHTGPENGSRRVSAGPFSLSR